MRGTSGSLPRKVLRIASIALLFVVPSTTRNPDMNGDVVHVDASFTSNMEAWPFGTMERVYVSGKQQDGGPAFLKRAVTDRFPVPAAWRARLRNVRDMALLDRLTMVNGLVNGISYVADENDEWKHPSVFLIRGGDCDCAAVSKYVLLRGIGVAARDIRIVGVANRGKSLLHAVVVVRSGGGKHQLFVLDTLSDPVRSVLYAAEYTPLVSLNENAVWLHDARGDLVAPAFADPVILEP